MQSRFRLEPESEDMLTVDLTRFLAAAGVVVLHFWQAVSFQANLDPARLDFLTLFVDVFFIISGFVIGSVYGDRMAKPGGYRAFMQKRLARLLPLHWATLLFFVGIALLLAASARQSNFPHAYDWRCVAPHALFLHAFGTCRYAAFNFPSWSISAEMALYLVFPLFLLLAQKARPLLVALAAVTLLGMYAISGGPNGDEAGGWTNWTFQFGAVRGLAGFSLGVALYAYRTRLASVPLALPLFAASFAAFIALGALGVPPMWLALLAYAIAFFAIAHDLSGRRGALMRRFSGLGQLTYSIYMLHIPVRFLMLVLIGEHLLHLEGRAYAIWAFPSALLVLPAAWISLIVFERPARTWLGGLGRHRRTMVGPAIGALAVEPSSGSPDLDILEAQPESVAGP